MRILVTGATGFVGRAVSEALLDADHCVMAAVRGSTANILSGCESVVVGDINAETSWSEPLEGIDAVVHLAARTHQADERGSIEAYRRINVEGSRQLARAAVTAGVHRFVYMSSIKVNGECSPLDANGTPVRLSADDEPRPTTLYGQTKWEAEQVLREVAAGTTMRLIVLRPPLVYGPGQRANLWRLMRAVDNGMPLPFAGIDNRRSLVDVHNLAAAVALAVVADKQVAGTYTLADVDLSSADLVQAMAAALGTRARLFPLPRWLLGAMAWLTGRSGQLDKITGSLLVDSERIAAALSWAPERSLERSLRETVVQYRRSRADRLC